MKNQRLIDKLERKRIFRDHAIISVNPPEDLIGEQNENKYKCKRIIKTIKNVCTKRNIHCGICAIFCTFACFAILAGTGCALFWGYCMVYDGNYDSCWCDKYTHQSNDMQTCYIDINQTTNIMMCLTSDGYWTCTERTNTCPIPQKIR